MTEPTEPTRIHGRYLLLERLATGGSADVWRARDEQLDRPVAIKLLHPHLLADETSRRRLSTEGRLLASLSHHPGIVQVYDVQPDGDAPALIMELIEGESLTVRLAREGPLPAREAAGIAADVAEALAHAHENGIVHRDVKPSNILIGLDGRARLTDFGIAHSLAPAAARLTMPGTVVGTLGYISPEQLNGGEVGPRTDLFGLGVVLFEMLNGRLPFDAASPLALAAAQAAGPPEMPGIDPPLAEITRTCLSQEVAGRPPNAGAVAESLRQWLALDLAPVAIVPAALPAEVVTDALTQPMAVVASPSGLQPEETKGGDGLMMGWLRRARPFALAAVGLAFAALLVIASLGPPKAPASGHTPASGETPTTSASPSPAWMDELAAEYADACGEALDPATIAGLSQSQAEEEVASLIDACDRPGKGKGRGNERP